MNPEPVIEYHPPVKPPSFVFGDPYHCTYCGAPPTCLDHVIPVSSYSNSKRRGKEGGIRTHSCHECNGALSDKVFEDFKSRAAFANERVIHKSQKFSRDASWSDEEIAALDDTLRSYVANRQLAMRHMDSRASWLGSSGYFNCLTDMDEVPYLNKSHPKYIEWLAYYFRHYV